MFAASCRELPRKLSGCSPEITAQGARATARISHPRYDQSTIHRLLITDHLGMIAYGRGRAVGCGRGVGVTLGAAVGVGVGVAVGVDVGLAVGVGVGDIGAIAYA